MYLLAKSRHYFVNGSLIVPENGLLNLASDLYDTVYVSMDFQAKDGSVFQMLVIDRSIVIGCFDNRIIMFLCELFQGIYVGKLLFTHSFKIYVKLSVLQHKVDAVHTIGTNTYKIIIIISCLHVSGSLSIVIRAATGILEFIPSFCVTRLFPCPQLNKLKIEVNIPIIFKNLIVLCLLLNR